LVKPYPYILGATTKRVPFGFISAIHRDHPEMFWAERVYNGMRGAWVPRTLNLVRQVYEDNVNFCARDLAPFAKLIGEDWFLVPVEADPPLHTTLRAMINPIFTPSKAAALEDTIRQYAREYLLALCDKGRSEFMTEFAFEFPGKVFLKLMGLPPERAKEFLAWEHKLLHEHSLDEIANGTRMVVDYLRGEIEDRKRNPRDDLISYGVQAEKNGRRLSENELLGFCFNLFIGGLDTVSTNIAWQFYHLAQNHDHQRQLRANPAMIPAAIDELMRVYASVSTSRECIRETVLGTVTVKPGDKVMLSTFLAGRDPDAYDNPETVILNRLPRHVSFGYGAHHCIGMHLARREMRIALEEGLSLLPEFSIPPDADITYYLAATIQPISMPVAWEP
jgi:cytochrome P450